MTDETSGNAPPRTARLASSTPELDAAEVEWWGRFSGVSERVWTLDPPVASALRSRYLRRAARYLVESAGRNGRVLDLGCGSGVTSRFLASFGVQVTGIDISETQIAIARDLAHTHPHSARMAFQVADVRELRSGGGRFHGIVGHAFLHHLARDELEETLAMASTLLSSTGRAWFYEPVFFSDGPLSASGAIAALTQRALRAMQFAARWLNLLNEETVALLDTFEAEAAAHGYFLSPKEVPFTGAEFREVLARHFSIDRIRWENTASYQLAALVALLKSPRLRRLGALAVKPATLLDEWIGTAGSPDTYRGLDGYGFASSFCRAQTA